MNNEKVIDFALDALQSRYNEAEEDAAFMDGLEQEKTGVLWYDGKPHDLSKEETI